MVDSSNIARGPSYNDPTETFDRSYTPPTMSLDPRGRVAIVEGPTLLPETAAQSLLRQRLLAASIVLCAGFGLFLIRSFLIERPLQGFHTLVVFAEGVCIALLAHPRLYSMRQLRMFELTMFGLPVLFFLPYQFLFMLAEAKQGSAVLTLAAFKSVALYWLVTMVFYGLIVPNDWKRAAWIIIPLTLPVPALAVAARPFHELVAQVVTVDQVSDVFLVLLIGALCSVYGAYIMNSLRIAAVKAQRFGQYRLLRPLGEGGMGQVYLAEHQLLKRPCAIKLIRPEQAGNPQALARFEREVWATAKLTHWNTIDIYDYGRTDDGTFYYVMEYLPGLDLGEMVRRFGPLPAGRVIHVLRQLSAALREAHMSGLIHRDIKPSNVIATTRGGVYDVVKLLDFGLAKPVADERAVQLTQEGMIAGTPRYISPEQCTANCRVDARSDIYSLGAVAYVLLTGHPPFDQASAVEVVIAHLREEVPPFSRWTDSVPQDLEAIVMRCLAKQPQDRFPNVEQLDAALSACQSAGDWTQDHARTWWRQAEAKSEPEPTGSSAPDPEATLANSPSASQ
jgi:eukaryotic-like serine/threonine-protein kinase